MSETALADQAAAPSTSEPGAVTPNQRRELREALKAAGVFERDPWRAWRKLVVLLVGVTALLVAALSSPHPAGLALLLPAAVLLTAAAMLGHEGAHKSMASSARHNAWMLHITFPFMSGLGAHHWKWKHNQLHHPHPNVPGVDFDLQMWPMASYPAQAAGAGPVRRLFVQHLQMWLFWPLTALLPYAMRLNSIRILLRKARADGVDRAVLLDGGCLLCHYTLWLVVPAQFVGLLPALGFYVLLWSMVGVLLSMVFAPAHMGMPVQPDHGDDWLAQLETTRNLLLPRWLSALFIGLDRQVEHHLFPGVSHFQLGQAAVITRQWAQRHKLPYHEVGYWHGLVDATLELGRVGRAVGAASSPQARPTGLGDVPTVGA